MRASEKRDALAVFPDALEGYILPTINALQEFVSRTRSSAYEKLRRYEDMADGWFFVELVRAGELEDVAQAERRIRRLRGYLPPPPAPKGGITEDDITRAREASIVQLAEEHGLKVRRSGSRHFTCCPFHQEKTASMCLFPDQRYYCFGCQAHGDVIDLTRALMGTSFVDAVKHLAYG